MASDVVDALEDRISELLQQIEKMKMQSEENAKISEKNILELQEITSEKLKSNSDEMVCAAIIGTLGNDNLLLVQLFVVQFHCHSYYHYLVLNKVP